MSYSKSAPFILALVVCLSATAAEAGQRGGGGSSRGGGSGSAGGSSRGGGGQQGAGRVGPSSPGHPGGGASHVGGPYRGSSYPYRSSGYRYPYYGYYGSAYPYLGFGLGLSLGYGYPYGYDGYPYGGYPYGYRPYGYSVVVPQGSASGAASVGYGGVRIQGAPADAQVFVDGYFVGTVQDFEGGVVSVEAGPRQIEIRAQDQPPNQFHVNLQPGQTLTYRTGRR